MNSSTKISKHMECLDFIKSTGRDVMESIPNQKLVGVPFTTATIFSVLISVAMGLFIYHINHVYRAFLGQW